MTKRGSASGASTSPVAPNAAAEHQAIRAMMDSYVAYFLAGDGERWLTLFDTDAVWMPPGEPAMAYDRFAKWAKSLHPGHVDAFANDNLDIRIAGDWAFVTGTYSLRGPAGDGTTYHADGKYLDVLKRQDDGAWKIFRCMFNLNTP